MSNLNTEKEYYSIKEMLDFVLDEHKKSIYVSMPAIINSYDQSTKRAKVLPALKVTYEDGSETQMPIINDVPVVMPAGGGYTITMPISSGDSVLLCFSHRNIEEFKETFALSSPNPQIMQLHDCVAIAGFGALSITPAGNGTSIQTNDGSKAVLIDNGGITLKDNSSLFKLTQSEMTATIGGATLTLNASSLTSSVPIDAPDFGSGGAAAQMSSGLNSPTIMSGGVNLTTHVHSDPQGGTTGTPQ